MTKILQSLEDYKRGRLRYFNLPPNLQFGQSSKYDLEQQIALEDILMLRGQRVQQVHDHGVEFNNQSVLSSRWVQNRHRKIRSRKNYQARIKAGAIASGALGIVGSNLDKRNTLKNGQNNVTRKETRSGLFRAQNALQKIRLGINLANYEFKVVYCRFLFDYSPRQFKPVSLKQPIISEATCQCGKPLGPRVQIQQSIEHGSASINQIQTCGSVWECPVCRNKIISERSEELAEIYNTWKERGGHCYMLTLTAPHKKADNLAKLYGSNLEGTGLSGALSRFRASRHFAKDFKDVSGYFGDVRGVEVTWGRSNGFHPHIHMLILTEETICFRTWKNRFYEAWVKACIKSGLEIPSFEHGVELSYCSDEGGATYLAKWSAASEVASQSMKEGKAGNFSIAELERCLWDRSFRSKRKMGMAKAASVLRSYYSSMKGQRMLQTGGISEDHNWKAELIGQNESNSENHRVICDLDYRIYCKLKRKNQLNELLEAAEFPREKDKELPIGRIKRWLYENGYDPAAVFKPSIKSNPTECGFALSRKYKIPPDALGSVSRPENSA